MPKSVAKTLFREGNPKFAVGYAENQVSPSAGIKVARDSAGAVDTAAFWDSLLR